MNGIRTHASMAMMVVRAIPMPWRAHGGRHGHARGHRQQRHHEGRLPLARVIVLALS